MCGFAGFIDLNASSSNGEMEDVLRLMGKAIEHRGPDGSGVWMDVEAGVGLVHQRLAVMDVSEAGHQPMASSSGRYLIAFNGEIYNFKALQKQLEADGFAYSWQGHSDTEVLLAVIECYGVDKALILLNGMFAFALWDKKERQLYLTRDRMGEKPLYYAVMGSYFFFASDLAALKVHPYFKKVVDRNVLASYLRRNYVPAPYSIYQDCFKLMPGTYRLVQAKGQIFHQEEHSYWSLAEAIDHAKQHPLDVSEGELIKRGKDVLREAVASRMEADVPLGAFLSGGIDSSLVVALMQEQSSKPVHSFSIGFHEDDYNEAHHAKRVAEHLGIQHTEHYVSAKEALAVVPCLPQLYTEPFADVSQIPTYLVSHIARKDVTVVLSGDGGDELFYGYNRYMWGKRLASLPKPIRAVWSHLLRLLPPSGWDGIAKILPVQSLGNKAHKLSRLLPFDDIDDFYQRCISECMMPNAVLVDGKEYVLPHQDTYLSGLEKMSYLDMRHYLPDDILVKLDRASMGVSLEARVPFLDHRVITFASQLPQHMKLRGGAGKWLLRRVLDDYVPRSVMERPKMGFDVPIDAWLRDSLNDWAKDLLDKKRLKEEGFFCPDYVGRIWQEHSLGRCNHQHHLWGILMFQAWYRNER